MSESDPRPTLRPTLAVQRAGESEIPAVASVLAEAFAEDPVVGWMLTKVRDTQAGRLALFEQACQMHQRDGLIETTRGLEAAALWSLPEPPPETLETILQDLRAAVPVFRVVGTALFRGIRLHRTTQRLHPREPHWYLAAIGTRRDARGLGAASALIAERLEVCDATQQPAYLESSNAANLPLYERHGFEVVQEIRVADSPPLWTMLREPRQG